jgi:hypothetical protein
MHCVLETNSFAASAKRMELKEKERHEITIAIANNPLLGDPIEGTGGARKVRFGKDGRGKSSGVRVVTFFPAQDVPVFLLDIYEKGEKISLSKAEKNEMKKILGGIADDYRASVDAKMARISESA